MPTPSAPPILESVAPAPRLPSRLTMALAGVIAVMLAGTIALWAHYGTAVFFEIIRAGFAACF
jgi:hypothetical protein